MSNFIIIRDEALRRRAVEQIAALNVSTPWRVTIEPEKKRRSLNQNSLYWKWVGLMADYSGHSSDEIHEFLKHQFLPPIITEINGKVIEYRATTTKLSTKDMHEYMEKVYAWATSEMGLFLPVPEDQGRE